MVYRVGSLQVEQFLTGPWPLLLTTPYFAPFVDLSA